MPAMLAKMSWEQFEYWRAYDALEPFGEDRADWRAAQIVSIIANVNRDPKTRPEPFSPSDFMPDFLKPPRAAGNEDPQAIWEEARAAGLAMAGAALPHGRRMPTGGVH